MAPKKISTQCGHCGFVLETSSQHLGRNAKCPQCTKRFVVQIFQQRSVETGPEFQECEKEASSTLANKRESRSTSIRDVASTNMQQPISVPEHGFLGRFELREVLGQGAFGRVFRAYDPQLDRELALKVPLFNKDEQKKAARFQAEAKASSRLRHPNIVPTYDSGLVGDQPYIATQFIEGETLASTIKKQTVAPEQAARCVVRIARALAYAHDMGIVHRDVKPQNIMLDSRQEPQLMDFGLAKRVNEDSGMTTEGALLGTPAYMSPEQARGDTANVGPMSDQYAVGAILYELLTGKRPFEGPPHAVLAQILSKEQPAPSTLRPDVPKDLEAITQKAMNKEPSKRYIGCAELAEDLERWLRGDTTLARPASSVERIVRWTKRNRALAASIIAIAAILAISFVGISLALYHAETARRRADQETRIALAAKERAEIAEAKANTSQNKLLESLAELNQEKLRAEQALADYESERLRANEEASRAVTQSQIAEEQRKLAKELESKAEVLVEGSRREKEESAESRYTEKLARANQEISRNNFVRADQILNSMDEQENLFRGWEWNHIHRKVRGKVSRSFAPSISASIGNTLAGCINRDGSRIVLLGSNGNIAFFSCPTGELLKVVEIPWLQAYRDQLVSESVASEIRFENRPESAFVQIQADPAGPLAMILVCAQIPSSNNSSPIAYRTHLQLLDFDRMELRAGATTPNDLMQSTESRLVFGSSFQEGGIAGSFSHRKGMDKTRVVLTYQLKGDEAIQISFLPGGVAISPWGLTYENLILNGDWIYDFRTMKNLRWNAFQHWLLVHYQKQSIAALRHASITRINQELDHISRKRTDGIRVDAVDEIGDLISVPVVPEELHRKLDTVTLEWRPRVLKNHGPVSAMDSISGLIATGTKNGEVKVVSPTLSVFGTYQLGSPISHLFLERSGKFIVALSTSEARIFYLVLPTASLNYKQVQRQARQRDVVAGAWMRRSPDSRLVLLRTDGLIYRGQPRSAVDFEKLRSPFFVLALSGDGQYAAGIDEGSLKIAKIPEQGEMELLPNAIKLPNEWSNAFMKDRKRSVSVIFAEDNSRITLLEQSSSQSEAAPRKQTFPIPELSSAPENLRSVTWWQIGDSAYVEFLSGKTVQIKGHEGSVTHIVSSKDGKRLFSGDQSGTVRIWNPDTGKELMQFSDRGTSVGGLALSADSQQLLVIRTGRNGFIDVLDSADIDVERARK